MQQRADWAGAFAGRPRAQPTLELVAPVQTSLSGARAFLGLTNSGDLYWIKATGNPQGNQVLVNECIVAAAAALIGAPVRPTALIAIPGELAGWRYGETELLRAGTAHGSLHLESAQFADRLTYFDRDDNAIRQPALLALWDWCMGEDEQWLYHLDGDQSIWSFDHGLWIGGGFDWTPESGTPGRCAVGMATLAIRPGTAGLPGRCSAPEIDSGCRDPRCRLCCPRRMAGAGSVSGSRSVDALSTQGSRGGTTSTDGCLDRVRDGGLTRCITTGCCATSPMPSGRSSSTSA